MNIQEELKNLNDAFKNANIIASLSSDEKKLELLEELEDEIAKSKVIASLSSDESKLVALKELEYDWNKASVIASLSSDENKVIALKELKDEWSKICVIESLSSDKNKVIALKELEDERCKFNIINTLSGDENKILALKELKEERRKFNIINTLSGDENKVVALKELEYDWNKASVIESLSSDENKILALKELKDEEYKASVIESLSSDENKLVALKELKDEEYKASVIESLSSDEKKIEALKEISDESTKALAISKLLLSGDKKREVLNTLLHENQKYKKIGLNPNMTIGMEIESEGSKSSIIKGLNIVCPKKEGDKIIGWETKTDGSLDEGVEVVSPILKDSEEDIEDVYLVCSMLKKCGQEVSERCGGHIHIGSDYLTSKEAYINLFEIWGNTEKIIYKICNEKGTIPRYRIGKYASSISNRMQSAIENGSINLESEQDLDSFITQIQQVQETRYTGMNLLNINNGKNTVEFRIPNGTINPNTWVENARLFGRLVQISQRLADIKKQPECSQEEEKLIGLNNMLKEEMPEQEKLETLLEILFTEEERQVYRQRYNLSNEILTTLPENANPLNKIEFGKVDFGNKKHGVNQFKEIAEKARVGEINEITEETIRVNGREEITEQTLKGR